MVSKIVRYLKLCKQGAAEYPIEPKVDVNENGRFLSNSFIGEDQEEQHLLEYDVPLDKEDKTNNEAHLSGRSRFRSKRHYRTTSPSYQAVELEFDQLFRFRETTSSSSDVLNIFGWNSGQGRPDVVAMGNSYPSSPQTSLADSASPLHSSSWSDYLSDGDHSDFSPIPSQLSPGDSGVASSSSNRSESFSPPGFPSPDHSPSINSPDPSSSEFCETDEEEEDNTICYSPANFDSLQFASPGSSPTPPSPPPPPPPSKKRKIAIGLCCDPDLKMSWLHLGQVEGKDFYENWPKFSMENRPPYNKPVEWAVYLLHRISWLPETPRQLTEKKIVATLIDYLIETPRPTFYACRLLFRLSSNADLFVGLVQAYFPLLVFLHLVRSTNLHCCPLHSSLRRVGEQILEQIGSIANQFGRGEMENVLLRNSKEHDDSVRAVALATPVIVKKKCLLRRFLIDFNVLEMIWNLLNDEESVTYAAASLASLGSFLKMDDMLCPSTELSDLFPSESCRCDGIADDVVFQTTSEEQVGAVKDLLQVEPFFQAMFRIGGFAESNSTVIKLPDIQASVLKVRRLYMCF